MELKSSQNSFHSANQITVNRKWSSCFSFMITLWWYKGMVIALLNLPKIMTLNRKCCDSLSFQKVSQRIFTRASREIQRYKHSTWKIISKESRNPFKVPKGWLQFETGRKIFGWRILNNFDFCEEEWWWLNKQTNKQILVK